jgi:hypothetical protein
MESNSLKTSILVSLFKNNRKTAFLIILLICSEFNREYALAQQAPEPPEGFMAGQVTRTSNPQETGLLFYLSASKGFTADFADGGQVLPNYLKDVNIIQDGAKGPGISADDSQLLTYWAPGNIYAQRGTISFFWRSRYPVGSTPFPVFRVGYADHSSWDMVWLRIDYNGSGFDAFVTDIGLTRTRVSYFMDKFPGPDEWIHIALSWDETEGIRFYVNGKLAARQSANGSVYDTGLDQFGPHSRIISPYQVQSAYSFMRGGDIDELSIYDRMLPDEKIAGLSFGNIPEDLPPLERNLSERRWRDAWWLRNGWNLPNLAPPMLPSSESSIRKVEIHNAFDIKRWYWKANDGIRETTWPGVYNMSRLPGRYDYFVLPDWDCYSGSGQSVKFTLPDEPWNHVEMWGKAWGQLTLESDSQRDYTFAVRSQTQIKSYHHLNEIQHGGKIRFDNALIEEPIGSFDVYYVDKGHAPEGTVSENFSLISAPRESENKAVEDLASFIRGRYPFDECTMMLGVPDGTNKSFKPESFAKSSYPFIHILIPYSDQPGEGLDGIEIKFPVLSVKSTHNGIFPINIRIKDPLWQMRDLADFSFSIKPGDSPTLWIDTRDRILPKERALYITIAGAGADLTSDLLNGTKVRMVYKSKVNSRAEHELDRFTQIRDLYAHIVEETPKTPRLNLYNRFMADCNDLLEVNPDHWLAHAYKYAVTGVNRPDYNIARSPDDIPEWAFYQIEYLRHIERVIMYFIDKRQIANGEFGGGLSDDDDLTSMWPGIAFLGIDPEKVLKSLQLLMTAYYDQERAPINASLRQRSLPLFTNGLATIFTDELHASEDGIEVLGQLQLLDYGSPLYLERGMETSQRLLEDITKINPAGHRHFRSRYFGGTRINTEDPWQWSVNRSYYILQPAFMLARYNGNPGLRKMISEIADGLLAHSRNGNLYTDINFSTDKDREDKGIASGEKPLTIFNAAYQLTGEKKFLEKIPARDPDIREFDRDRLTKQYVEEIKNLGVREYINTEGSVWIDRVSRYSSIIQEDRLGGTALTRLNVLYPQHFLSWKFNAPATYESAAIFLSRAQPDSIKIIAYNLDLKPVNTDMTVWDIKPGQWRVRQGLDTNDDQLIDSNSTDRIVDLERGELINLVFAPRKYNIVTLELIKPAEQGYWERPDLGIGPNDIKINGNSVKVRVHSLGSVATPVTTLELRDAKGKLVATAPVPPLEAPLDLKPRWTDIILIVPEGTDISSGSVKVDPEAKIKQITRRNTLVRW